MTEGLDWYNYFHWIMTVYRPGNGMLAGAQLCMMHAARNPQFAPNVATYTFLTFKVILCLTGKIIY